MKAGAGRTAVEVMVREVVLPMHMESTDPYVGE